MLANPNCIMKYKKIVSVFLVFMFLLIAIPLTVSAQSDTIPEWIKNTAGFWARGEISDIEFINAMEFLIGSGIIQVPGISVSNTNVEELTIGFIPTEKAEELTPNAEKLEKYLENKLGTDVNIVVPTNYESIIEGLRFGHIDAAFMDTGPGWIANQRSGAEVVLSEVVQGKVNQITILFIHLKTQLAKELLLLVLPAPQAS